MARQPQPMSRGLLRRPSLPGLFPQELAPANKRRAFPAKMKDQGCLEVGFAAAEGPGLKSPCWLPQAKALPLQALTSVPTPQRLQTWLQNTRWQRQTCPWRRFQDETTQEKLYRSCSFAPVGLKRPGRNVNHYIRKGRRCPPPSNYAMEILCLRRRSCQNRGRTFNA